MLFLHLRPISYHFSINQEKTMPEFILLALETVDGLVLAERIETIIPITYLICFMMAWYGPNSKILGGVKLDIKKKVKL